ncbi:MAG: hypothetical protein RLN80_12605, partial [Rhodospirillales bacterium]
MGTWYKLTVLAGLFLLISAHTAMAGCPGGEGATRLTAGSARLVYRPVGEITVGEPFELEICIDPVPADVRLTVDAIMP